MASSTRSLHASSLLINRSEPTVPTRNFGLINGRRTCCKTCVYNKSFTVSCNQLKISYFLKKLLILLLLSLFKIINSGFHDYIHVLDSLKEIQCKYLKITYMTYNHLWCTHTKKQQHNLNSYRHLFIDLTNLIYRNSFYMLAYNVLAEHKVL